MGTTQTRLNVNMNEQTSRALKEHSTRHGISVTETLRRMIGVAKFILDKRDNGYEILVRRNDVTEIVTFTF